MLEWVLLQIVSISGQLVTEDLELDDPCFDHIRAGVLAGRFSGDSWVTQLTDVAIDQGMLVSARESSTNNDGLQSSLSDHVRVFGIQKQKRQGICAMVAGALKNW